MIPESVRESASKIRLLILDVDGVLTDGQIFVDLSQESLKSFDVQDGLGIQWLIKNGFEVAIITGKASEMVSVRAKNLGIQHVYQGEKNKRKAFVDLLNQLKLEPWQVAYVGDDFPDAAPLSLSGLAVAVANAHPKIRAMAHWVTQKTGGHGAVREVCELILSAQGMLEPIYQQYLVRGGLS